MKLLRKRPVPQAGNTLVIHKLMTVAFLVGAQVLIEDFGWDKAQADKWLVATGSRIKKLRGE